ncbi:MAG TPA: shikimate dehydrogenase [Ktedonobacteraceae bacterium]|nr:shikimate dehydrogenase [Ktedonobacteraceae bacterium]
MSKQPVHKYTEKIQPVPSVPVSVQRVGLIGDPVAHSFSPRLQQAAFDALGISARYELWQTSADALATRVASLLHPQFLGANVTIPHKEAVLPLLDIVDPLASRIGAVNTIVHQNEYLHGYNTDAPGLLNALADYDIGTRDENGHVSLKGYTVVLLGAGGAARSAAFAVASASVTRLIIVNRNLERAQQLANNVGNQFMVSSFNEAETTQVFCLNDTEFLIPHPRSIIINATSVGMHTSKTEGKTEDESPLPSEILTRFTSDTFILDMVYNPVQTRLLIQARTLGLRAVNGLPMLLHQGALAFTLWTGQPAPLDIMRSTIL